MGYGYVFDQFDEFFRPITKNTYQWTTRSTSHYRNETEMPSDEIWVPVPGVTKNDLDAKIEAGLLVLKWESKYGNGMERIQLPKSTKNIEVEVDNGMAIIRFDTQESDISIEIK